MKRNFNLLSDKETEKRKLTLKAITDYFGEKINVDMFNRIVRAIQGRGKVETEEERLAVFLIKTNLADSQYLKSLCGTATPISTF